MEYEQKLKEPYLGTPLLHSITRLRYSMQRMQLHGTWLTMAPDAQIFRHVLWVEWIIEWMASLSLYASAYP